MNIFFDYGLTFPKNSMTRSGYFRYHRMCHSNRLPRDTLRSTDQSLLVLHPTDGTSCCGSEQAPREGVAFTTKEILSRLAFGVTVNQRCYSFPKPISFLIVQGTETARALFR